MTKMDWSKARARDRIARYGAVQFAPTGDLSSDRKRLREQRMRKRQRREREQQQKPIQVGAIIRGRHCRCGGQSWRVGPGKAMHAASLRCAPWEGDDEFAAGPTQEADG